MEACKEAGLKARGSKIKCKSQNKWLDQECKTEKKTCNPLGRKFLITIIIQNWDNCCKTKTRVSNKLVDGRNGSISAKECLLSIWRKLQRDLATNSSYLTGPLHWSVFAIHTGSRDKFLSLLKFLVIEFPWKCKSLQPPFNFLRKKISVANSKRKNKFDVVRLRTNPGA